MAKFGRYKTADVQSGLGAFPDTSSNIAQNTQPTMDNATIAEGQSLAPKPETAPAGAGPKVLSSDEIYNILKNNGVQ
jgi:hypothetical protein